MNDALSDISSNTSSNTSSDIFTPLSPLSLSPVKPTKPKGIPARRHVNRRNSYTNNEASRAPGDPLFIARIPESPFLLLTNAMLETAMDRITAIKDYGTNFIRLSDPDCTSEYAYEYARCTAIYHVSWLMNDTVSTSGDLSSRITFRDLIGLSGAMGEPQSGGCRHGKHFSRFEANNPRLTPESARAAILSHLSRDALRSLEDRWDAKMMETAVLDWLAHGMKWRPKNKERKRQGAEKLRSGSV